MTDRLLLCAKRQNFDTCVALAQEYNTGIEVQTFAYPPLMADGWRDLLREYQGKLRAVPGEIALHGPFMDLAGGSFDPLINDVVRQRVREALVIASEIGARTIVFHANYIAAIRHPTYRTGWTARQLDFWGPLAEEAWAAEHVIALENMWEFDPDIIGDVLRQLDHPGLRACVDVGHTSLFSDYDVAHWLGHLNGLIAHMHLNNHDGEYDRHSGLDDGVLDYGVILPQLDAVMPAPTIALEIEHTAAMQHSLDFIRQMVT
ncbi:MAG: sugar phosphate isomerase/epimerase [Anaerolineae bacterium]|nr:sugar phosphate isomerase/epimerase [Anaerolineae bacterium]